MKRIPSQGIVGEAALREAAAGEFASIMDLVRRAVLVAIYPNEPDGHVMIEAIYTDRVVMFRDGRRYAYPYTISDDNQVQIGQPEEVVLDHTPVRMREAQGMFLEAQDEAGLKWRIRVIKAGLSGNRNYYPDDVLREAAPLFNGTRVFVKADDEHIKGQGKSFNQLIGRLSNTAFVEGQARDTGEVHADLDVLQSTGDVPAKMLEAHQRGMADLFGFSIDADGLAKHEKGRRVAKRITKVNSVDLIIEPGAGGQLINLIEAYNPKEQDMALRERMIEAIKAKHGGDLPEGLNVDDDDALDIAYREAVQTHTPQASNGPETGQGRPVNGLSDDVREEIRMVEARAKMRAKVAASGLPDIAKDRLRNQFDGLERFTEAQVDEAINGEREYLAKFTESGHVAGLGEGRVEGGEDRSEKVVKMMDDFFDQNNRDVRSFKECYVEITGDRRVTGDLRDCDPVRMREALGIVAGFREALDSTSFANVLGDSITRRMVADYRTPTMYDVWRNLATTAPVSDFRTQERTRFGGYGDLPTVAENGAYNPLMSVSDEKATYAVAKKGGTETISLEMIRNDDVGAVQRIPTKLSRASRRTLSKFVLDFIKDNPVIYDGLAWFHATHSNLGTAALSPSSLAVARLAMLRQTEMDSLDPLGIPPMHLWVSSDQEEAAFDLFRRTTNNDTDFIETLQMQIHPVWYWTDADDWAVTADTADIPVVEVGFLDGNEEPELFVQDSPTVGSLFSNDQITYKIRHIYGGNVLDYRGAYKAVVAGL